MVRNTALVSFIPMEIPVRLCCGQRHWTMQCPDGKVQCCICWSRFELDELHIDGDGQREDVCEPCDRRNTEIMEAIGKGICVCPRYRRDGICRHVIPFRPKEDVEAKEEYL